jgi:hypothetical protein
VTQNYRVGLEFLSAQFPEVNGYEFYRDVFPDNENSGELYTDFSHPNAIYLYRDEADAGTPRSLRRRIMLKDAWEQDYVDHVERNPMTLCSGLAYRHRANKLDNAQRMNTLVFDLDGVGGYELEVLFYRFDGNSTRIRTLPAPTYLVLSGNGVHVYYVFDRPVDLYPNIKLQMKQLKYDLTFRLWEYKATSQMREIQYQSINQGFRMVGSINERYGTEVKAFHVGERVTLDYLNKYARFEENRVDVNRPFKPSKMTRAEAAEKYPEWYQRVVVEGNRRLKKWDIAGQKGHVGDELYKWWFRQAGSIRGGHRYFYLMCLAIYACKCDIPKRRLKQDMQAAFKILREIPHGGNELTQADVQSALEAYSKEYYNFTIDDIEHLTDVRIERNKRNGRKQSLHLRIARASRDIICEERGKKDWREGNGRPSARQRVIEYRLHHDEATKAECVRSTGLSKPTVYKWWKEAGEWLNAEADVYEFDTENQT